MKKSRNVRYLTREGLKNVNTNRLMSVASIAVLMSCLVIIGSALLIFFNVDALLEKIESQNIIMAFCDFDCDDETVAAVGEDINKIANIESSVFISREEAFNRVVASLGNNAGILADSDDEFLPVGYEITVADMSLFPETVKAIKNIEHIYSVQENSPLAARLQEVRNAVTYVSIGIILLLFVVSIFIIANTVKITMFSRKLEISIMKAVGATNWFIRWPFLIEGVTLGLISAVLSFGVLYLLYFLCSDSLLAIFGLLGNELVSFADYAVYIFIGFFVVSVFTGGLGSIISIGKYLKEQGSVVSNDN